MASNPLKKEVLSSFKKIHKTRQIVFKNSPEYLEAARKEINSHYVKNKNITNVESIKELIELARGVELEMKTLAEVEKTDRGTYRILIRPDMLQNNPVRKINE